MALPEFVPPVIAYVGTPALAYIAARSLWHVALAVVVMVASFVVMKTDDDKRRTACLTLVDKVTRRSTTRSWSRRRPIGHSRSSR
jgi:hypothetical protein